LNQLIGYDRQLAGFGEATTSITDQLKLTTGIRFSKDDYTFNSYSDGPQNGGPEYGSGVQHEKPITYRGGLSFQQNPNNLYYATFSTGFRVGGANAIIPHDLCADDYANFGIFENPAQYQSDKVKSYEVGAKNNFNNKLKLATSVYYIQWNNIQQTVTLPSCALSYIANLGSAISEGMDLQIDYAMTDSLTFESAIGYNDSHYTGNAYPGSSKNPDGSAATPLVSKGDAIVGQSLTPGAPWTITLGAEYKFVAFGGRDNYLRVDAEHDVKNTRLTAAEDPSTLQYGSCNNSAGVAYTCNYNPSATTFVSFRAGTIFNGWNASFFIDNLFDTHTTTEYNYQGTDPNAPVAPSALYRNFTFRPRTFGLTFTYRN
jgi:iron complex outermembrane recepter protein